MSLEGLEQRIRKLEDIEEIKKLKHSYCALCDDHYNADALAELFTEDAIWDGMERGRNDGREAIREFFQDAPARLPFAIHMVMNPIIEVDGDRATGVWYLFQPCTYAEGNQAVWGSARYDEEYVRVNGKWMFQHLTLSSHFWTPFDKGRVEAKFA